MRQIRSAVITGPTGAVGTALCKLLAQEQITVWAVVRPESKRAEHLKKIEGVRIIPCDAAALRRDTGFEARTAFEDGIRETIDYVRGMIQNEHHTMCDI